MDRINYFFGSMKNIGIAIIVWLLIAFGVLELWGCAYVNWIQKDPNAPVQPPAIAKAQYEAYVKANRRYYYSDDGKKVGTVVYLNGYYAQEGDGYRFYKLPLTMDENDWGAIEFRRRE